MSDVRLKNGYVEVEGQLRVEGSDVHLSDDRRRDDSNSARYRRAMVHGSEDKLVLNYDNDYTGVEINGRKSLGITMFGTTQVAGQLRVEGTDIHLNAPERRDANNREPYRRALVHGQGDELIINFSNDYHGVAINARENSAIRLNGPTILDGANLADTLSYLLAERQRLYGAINELERKVGLPPTMPDPPSGVSIRRGIKIPRGVKFKR